MLVYWSDSPGGSPEIPVETVGGMRGVPYFLQRYCVPGRVFPIRRIRGWAVQDSYDPGLPPGATLSRSCAAL